MTLSHRLARLEGRTPVVDPRWQAAIDLWPRAMRERPPVDVDERYVDLEPTMRHLAALSGVDVDELLEVVRQSIEEVGAGPPEGYPARIGRADEQHEEN